MTKCGRRATPLPCFSVHSVAEYERPTLPEGSVGRPTPTTRSQRIDSFCSSSCRRRDLMVCTVGRSRSSGFHPQAIWPDRMVHRCGRCESGRVADQPLTWHTKAPTWRGKRGATALSHSSRSSHPDRRTPKPFGSSAPSSEFPLEPHTQGVTSTESRSFP